MLIVADYVPFTEQNPARKYQLPVMFRILFNCGLRTSELLNLRMCDVDLKENVFTILDTKFHKNRLVPFSDSVSVALTQYLERFPSESPDSLIFPAQVLVAMAEDTETVGCKLNSVSFSEWQGFLIMDQEKVHGSMISGIPSQYTA